MTVWGTPGTPKKINIDQPSGDHCTPSSPDIAQSSSSDVLPARPCRAAAVRMACRESGWPWRGCAAWRLSCGLSKGGEVQYNVAPPLQVGLNAIDHSIT